MKRRWPIGLLAMACLGACGVATLSLPALAANQPNNKAGPASGKSKQGKEAGRSTASQSNQKPARNKEQHPETKPGQNTGQQPDHKAGQAGLNTGSNASTNNKSKPAAEQPFTYDKLVGMAKNLAGHDYKAPPQIPNFLSNLSPDAFGKIHYKRDDALWSDQKPPFEAMFYHPGSYYTHAVEIHVVNNGKVRTFSFDKNFFDYPDPGLKKKVPEHLGYAGFKILHELNTIGKLDEVMSFLGASYFRALGANEHYGLSARGLAIDTGSPSGEEFPNFTQFWLLTPDKHSSNMTILALLNSPSVTGAYKFVLTPGQATHTHVEETLFTRKPIKKLGLAPLTSMFTWGENSLARTDDFRPEAHDSDGMLISSANGEWLWRPLVNPQTLWMNQFQASNVRGFGLMQRDRKFDDYQDLNYEYERRPNAWVTPDGDWGDGHLELVEIPSDSEVNDNIGLYWVPNSPVKGGQRLHFAYDIKWSSHLAVPGSIGHVAATRVGMAAVAPGQKKNQVMVAIDFIGGKLAKLTDPHSVQPHVTAARDVTLNNIQAVRNPNTDGWRLTFLVPANALDTPLELRAYLAEPNNGGLTETWSYALKTP